MATEVAEVKKEAKEQSVAKPNFSGNWKVTKSQQFDEYLAAHGVNWATRKIILASRITHEIEHKDDDFKVKITNPRGSYQTNIKIGGGEYDTRQGPNHTCKATAKWVGGSIQDTLVGGMKGPEISIRSLEHGKMIVRLENSTLTPSWCTRTFVPY